jgi:hypothetical protein
MKDIKHNERGHHDTLPPSSFPAFEQCPCYRPEQNAGRAAQLGTKLHEQFEKEIEKWRQSK